MKKNRQMDVALSYLRKRIDQITPSIYAAFAIALTEKGWSVEEISELFGRTQEIWEKSIEDDRDMVQICSDEIGIDIMAGVKDGY